MLYLYTISILLTYIIIETNNKVIWFECEVSFFHGKTVVCFNTRTPVGRNVLCRNLRKRHFAVIDSNRFCVIGGQPVGRRERRILLL